MILDAFPFWNELDLLELRFRELDDLVDRWLVVQGQETHAGTPKPLFFDRREPRWAPWRDRIDQVTVERLPATVSREEREHWGRTILTLSLVRYPSDALVIYSDVDEIPDKAVVRDLAPLVTRDAWVGLRPRLFHYYLNLLTPQAWSAIALIRADTLLRLGGAAVRDARKHPPVSVPRGVGGWHFAWTGGVEAIRAKLGAWMHEEFDTPRYRDPGYLAQCIAERRHLFGRPGAYRPVPLTEMPGEVQQHPERYAHLLLPEVA